MSGEGNAELVLNLNTAALHRAGSQGSAGMERVQLRPGTGVLLEQDLCW